MEELGIPFCSVSGKVNPKSGRRL